ncbi:hypothetical protein LEMLEM_LOCUS13931 [Lemmus lemmus]
MAWPSCHPLPVYEACSAPCLLSLHLLWNLTAVLPQQPLQGVLL